MSLLMRPMTYDDLQEMPDDGNRYELIGGELHVSPAPITAHQQISGRLFNLFSPYVEAQHLGLAFYAPVDVRFGLHDEVQPDLLFIRQDRLGIISAKGVVEGSPDVVIEILSPSTAAMDRVRKAALYAGHGVREYWIVDPKQRTVELFTLVDTRWVPVDPDGDGRLESPVVPGISVDPTTLFSGILWTGADR